MDKIAKGLVDSRCIIYDLINSTDLIHPITAQSSSQPVRYVLQSQHHYHPQFNQRTITIRSPFTLPILTTNTVCQTEVSQQSGMSIPKGFEWDRFRESSLRGQYTGEICTHNECFGKFSSLSIFFIEQVIWKFRQNFWVLLWWQWPWQSTAWLGQGSSVCSGTR